MSTSITAAMAALRARAEAQITIPITWQGEDSVLPDTPADFVHIEFVANSPNVIEIGGGRGANRHRNTGEVNAYVFVPRGAGMAYAVSVAETVAAVFRSYRASGITIETAGVHPIGEGEALAPNGMDSAAGNYACAVVNAPLFFDQIA